MRVDFELRLRRMALACTTAGMMLFAAGAGSAHQDEPKSDSATEPPAMHGATTPETDAGTAPLSGMPMPGMPQVRVPSMDPLRGKQLFVEKGCVACHAVNGVGGHDAAALDAHAKAPIMNPFDFAAIMWRMAPAMVYAQEEAFGEQVQFTGDELADIYAFLHTDEAQHDFSEGDITPRVRKLMDHSHGEPGGGAMSHGAELGHGHGSGEDAAPHEDN